MSQSLLPVHLIPVSPHISPSMAVILLPSTCCLPVVERTVFQDFAGKERRESEEEGKEVISSSVHPPYEIILIQVLCARHCYTLNLQLSYSLHFDFDFSKLLSHHVSFDVLHEDVADSILKKLNI